LKWGLLAFSAILALAYGVFGADWYRGAPPFTAQALFKASSVVVLSLIALMGGPRLLATGLWFGALGDALLAWRQETFLFGALAFVFGHLCYIWLFLSNGMGPRAALRDRTRVLLITATLLVALLASRLTPQNSPLYGPLTVYSAVLTAMALSSYTLAWPQGLAMAGALLFFVSDGFVAWDKFHPDANPTLAFWRGFAGWMIYWSGQALLCFGGLGLAKREANRDPGRAPVLRQ